MRPCHQYVCFESTSTTFTRDVDRELHSRPDFICLFWKDDGEYTIMVNCEDVSGTEHRFSSRCSCNGHMQTERKTPYMYRKITDGRWRGKGGDLVEEIFRYNYAAMRGQMGPLRTELLRAAMHPRHIHRLCLSSSKT